MSDAVDHGITVTEIASMDKPIDVCPVSTAAFIGRALRGPVNTPVLVTSFAEFARRFGGIWARSSLGPAVRQFFDQGGTRLYVVRVANNARGAMLCLPANGSALILHAVDPGSTEVIRAAVDYDGLDESSEDRFNLTLQRINPANGLVADQEFFKSLSWQIGDDDFVADALLTSKIACVVAPYPMRRPELTIAPGSLYESTYVEATQPGTDGEELTNYDLVGSRQKRSGLFSLEQVEYFDLLYLPPPGKNKDVGPPAILAAEMYCRDRSALLVVDPPASWTTAEEAVQGTRAFGYASPNMLGYFPRVLESGSGSSEARAAGGAIVGVLCRHDLSHGIWQSLDQSGLGLQRKFKAAQTLSPEAEQQLVRAGLNVLRRGPNGKLRVSGAVTMGRGSEAVATYSQLPVRRFCLQVVNTISRSTRWAVFEAADDDLAGRVRGQILTYFDCLNDLGAFENDQFVVQCDAGVSKRADSKEHGVTVLLVFHPAGSEVPISLTLHQTVSHMRVGSTAFGLSTRNAS